MQMFSSMEQETSASCVIDIDPPVGGVISLLSNNPDGSIKADCTIATDVSGKVFYAFYCKEGSLTDLFNELNIVIIKNTNSADIYRDNNRALIESGKTYYIGVRAFDEYGNETPETTILSIVADGLGYANLISQLAKQSTLELVKAKTDNLPVDPADNSEILTAISTIPGPSSPGDIADAVRVEIAVELARIDVAISTRNDVAPDNAKIIAIKAKTDNLPNVPASESNVSSVGSAVVAVGNLVDALPTLSEIESSTVLAKEASIDSVKSKTDNLPIDPASESSVNTVSTKADEIKTNTDLIPATI